MSVVVRMVSQWLGMCWMSCLASLPMPEICTKLPFKIAHPMYITSVYLFLLPLSFSHCFTISLFLFLSPPLVSLSYFWCPTLSFSLLTFSLLSSLPLSFSCVFFRSFSISCKVSYSTLVLILQCVVARTNVTQGKCVFCSCHIISERSGF